MTSAKELADRLDRRSTLLRAFADKDPMLLADELAEAAAMLRRMDEALERLGKAHDGWNQHQNRAAFIELSGSIDAARKAKGE